MFKVEATMVLDNALPHFMGEYEVEQLLTAADFSPMADEVLQAFETMYSPERMEIAVGTETEVLGLIRFDESGTWEYELA